VGGRPGIDPDDTNALRRFDKKREGRKTSNEDRGNPHDPDAKVGRNKDGACDMVYTPKHLTDLETGAIVRPEVRAGNAGVSEALCWRVLEGCETLDQVLRERSQPRYPLAYPDPRNLPPVDVRLAEAERRKHSLVGRGVLRGK